MKEKKASKKNLATTLTDFLADKLSLVDAPTAQKINKSLEKFAKKLAEKFEKEKGKLIEKADKKAAKLSKKTKKTAFKAVKTAKTEATATKASRANTKAATPETPISATFKKPRAKKDADAQPTTKTGRPPAASKPATTAIKQVRRPRAKPAGQPNDTPTENTANADENTSGQ